MSAPQFMRATPPATICSTGFVRARTLYTRLKRPNSATFPESAFCICNAISAGIRCAWRGATVTGLDFSNAALNVARRLSDETGLKADFVEGTVDQAPDLAPGPFDLVFTTWGTICWLPDVKQWAKASASVLAPGGELYFADAHPGFNVLEDYAGRFVPAHDFQTPADRPLQFASETTYTGDPTIMSHQSTREWIHSLSAVLGGLIDAGLTITMFREHEVLPWRGLASLVPASERMWRLPDGAPRIPLCYSVRAKKGA
jgi:SAM-dependent methyltransferase